MREFIQKNISFSKAVKIVKLILFLAVIWCLYGIVTSESFRWQIFLNSLKQAFGRVPFVFLFSFLLMFLNWSLEARKWQLLASKVEKISFGEAFKSVVAGLGLGLLIPQGIGDYAGRALRLQSRYRFRTAGVFLLGNSVQLFTAIFFGCISSSTLLLLYKPELKNTWLILMLLESFLLFFFLLFIFRTDRVAARLSRLRYISKLSPYLETVGAISHTETAKIFLLSVSRYLTFSLQFILILKAFDITLNFLELFAAVSSVFLIKSIVPAFNFLGDLGIREVSSIYFFGLFLIPEEPVLAASLCLWFINIFLPTICGLIFIPGMKLAPNR